MNITIFWIKIYFFALICTLLNCKFNELENHEKVQNELFVRKLGECFYNLPLISYKPPPKDLNLKIALINKLPWGKKSIILLRRTDNYHCGVDTRYSWNEHRSFTNLKRLTEQKEIGRIFHKFWKE